MATNDWKHLHKQNKTHRWATNGPSDACLYLLTRRIMSNSTAWDSCSLDPACLPTAAQSHPGSNILQVLKMTSFHNSGPLLILFLLPRMPCLAHLARSSFSWTLSSRMCLWNCLLSKWGSLSWAEENKKYNTGRACQPIKPGCAGSLNKCTFYGSIMAPNAHTATYAGVIKVMHLSY